jgi:hypothetical protein
MNQQTLRGTRARHVHRQRAAEAQEGSLVVSSEGLGLGATFRLTLKLAPAASVAQATLPLFELGPPAMLPQIQG